MVQRGERECFLAEAGETRRIARQIGRQELDRDLAVEPRVAREIDLSHAAFAQRAKDQIGTESIICRWQEPPGSGNQATSRKSGRARIVHARPAPGRSYLVPVLVAEPPAGVAKESSFFWSDFSLASERCSSGKACSVAIACWIAAAAPGRSPLAAIRSL